VAGERDHERVAAAAASGANSRYQVFAYLDDFELALAAADLAVGRAGGSVAELLALGLPSLLVPWPLATSDHQTKNAQALAAAGAAVWLPEGELTAERLHSEVTRLLDPAVRRDMGRAARALARPQAATLIADEIVQLAGPPEQASALGAGHPSR
jgi:UDP-N-acetylglucosamine--N-acetylmuramyl-(pentapeptide) pyrophosphoryl-undecaprenol N-acetylglucosamine transferase